MQEDKLEYERSKIRDENAFRGRVFAADLPHGLNRYREIFPPEGSPEAEYGPIEERVPQNEKELHELMNEMKRAGASFAD